MKYFQAATFLLTVVLFSASAWADGIDPKVIPIKGTGSTPITITNPNPTVNATAVGPNAANLDCLGADACVDDVFQNQTGKTLTSITMFFSSSANPGLIFSCGDMTQALFFDNCNAANVAGGEDIILSADGKNGFTGVASAVLGCVEDCDNPAFVGGEFGVDIYGDLVVGQNVSVQAVTTPEPGAGLMLLLGVLAFGLLKLVGRAV
jgi:hypothetical protein